MTALALAALFGLACCLASVAIPVALVAALGWTHQREHRRVDEALAREAHAAPLAPLPALDDDEDDEPIDDEDEG